MRDVFDEKLEVGDVRGDAVEDADLGANIWDMRVGAVQPSTAWLTTRGKTTGRGADGLSLRKRSQIRVMYTSMRKSMSVSFELWCSSNRYK